MPNDAQSRGRGLLSLGAWPASWLYVPANRPELLNKAARSEAHALIVDLEDAVPQAEKNDARRNLTDWLTELSWSSENATDRTPASTDPADYAAQSKAGAVNGKQVWARINAEYIVDDVSALLGQYGEVLCAGVVLAKAEPQVLATLEDATQGRVPIIGLVESAAGLRSLEQMAASTSVMTFGIGEVDLLADLRMHRSLAAEAAIDAIRIQVITACAAAGLRAPVAPTSTDFRDLDAFAVGTRKFRDLGFRARTAIHPAQCAVANDVFTPTAQEVAEAQQIVDRSANASGGVTLDDSGRLIDAAVVRGAIETLEQLHAASAPVSPSGYEVPRAEPQTRRD